MIAATERTKLLAHIPRRDLRRTLDHLSIAFAEIGFPRAIRRRRRIAMRALADRNHLLDRLAYAAKVAREILGTQRELLRDHSATHVHPDSRRYDRADCRDHASDRRALADVNVRHDRDVFVNERKGGHVLDLTPRAGVELDTADPRLDRTPARLDDFHDDGLLRCKTETG